MENKVLKQASLKANSVKSAMYEIRLIELHGGGGYAICKLSGPLGKGRVGESWYREDLPTAERKYDAILRQKTTRSAGRIYSEAPPITESQLNLF